MADDVDWWNRTVDILLKGRGSRKHWTDYQIGAFLNMFLIIHRAGYQFLSVIYFIICLQFVN